MNYSTIKKHDIANGIGVRVSIFVTGCTHKCEGCFNSEIWDFASGNPFDESAINEILESLAPNYIRGLSLLGGEPFEPANQEGLLPLLKAVKTKYPEKDIWAYSGYLFDKDMLEGKFKDNPTTKQILGLIDILVDGKFIMAKKDLNLHFRGSSNQRIIDVQKSLNSGEITLSSLNNIVVKTHPKSASFQAN